MTTFFPPHLVRLGPAASLVFMLGSALAEDQLPAVALEPGFDAGAQAGRLLTLTEAQALKGIKRVVVPLFSIDFVTADSEKAETSGFAAAGRATSMASYTLKGMTQGDFQALTDAAYGRFLADLQAAGFDTVSADRLQASATYRKLLASGKPAPVLRSDGMMLAPAGMGLYGFSQVASGGSKPGLFNALSSMGSSFSAVGSALDTIELAKELDAAVLEVQLVVQFVQLTNENKGFLGRLAGSATVSAKVYPHIARASYSVQSPTPSAARSVLSLRQPLALDAAAITEVRSAPTTAMDVAGAVVAGLINLASRSGNSVSSDEKEAIADPVRYSATVGQGLSAVNQMVVQRLRVGE